MHGLPSWGLKRRTMLLRSSYAQSARPANYWHSWNETKGQALAGRHEGQFVGLLADPLARDSRNQPQRAVWVKLWGRQRAGLSRLSPVRQPRLP